MRDNSWSGCKEKRLPVQVYICGEADSVELPDDPLSIQPRASAMKSLQASPVTCSTHVGRTFQHPIMCPDVAAVHLLCKGMEIKSAHVRTKVSACGERPAEDAQDVTSGIID